MSALVFYQQCKYKLPATTYCTFNPLIIFLLMQLICFQQDMLKMDENIDKVTLSAVWFCPQIKVIQSVAVIEEERNQINSLSLFLYFFKYRVLPFSFPSLDFFSPIFSRLSIQWWSRFSSSNRDSSSVCSWLSLHYMCVIKCVWGVFSVSSTSPWCTEEVSWSLTCHNK